VSYEVAIRGRIEAELDVEDVTLFLRLSDEGEGADVPGSVELHWPDGDVGLV
jgi:hypothetical protein